MRSDRFFIATLLDSGEPDLVSIFRQVDLFQDLPEEALTEIAAFAQAEQYYSSQTIIAEGEPGSDIFLVITGKVRIQVESISPYVEIGFSKIEPGEVFGEMALLEETPRSASAITTEPTLAARINGPRLREFIASHPEPGMLLMRNTARIMAERLKSMNRRMMNYLRTKYF